MTATMAVLAVTANEHQWAAALVGANHDVLDDIDKIVCESDPAPLVGLIQRKLRAARTCDFEISGLAFAFPDDKRWQDLQTAVAEQVDLPITHERVATAALRGECLRSATIECGSAVLIDFNELRLGLLLNGHAYAGATGNAGDIAHLGIDRTGVVRCTCGRNGCLKALLECGADAPLPPLSQEFTPVPTQPLGWIAVATVALVNTFNPALLFLLGAPIEDTSEFAWLAAAIRRGCLRPARGGLLDIVQAREDSALVGAAARFATHH